MTFIPVEHVDEVLREALGPAVEPGPISKRSPRTSAKRPTSPRGRKAAASA